MAKHNQHLIARQVLELDVPSVTRAPEIQEAVAQRLRDRAMTEMETLFDRLGPPDKVVRLERLEIDLGDLGGTDWQEQFESRLVAQLGESLSLATTEWMAQSSTSGSDHGTPFEQYLYFLQHGRLPWWGERPSADWPQPLLQALTTPQWQSLETLLARNQHAQLRLIHALDDELLSTLLSRHAGLHGIMQVYTLWRPTTLPQILHTPWRTQFWLAVLSPVTITGEMSRGIEIMRRLLRIHHAFTANASPLHGRAARGTYATPALPDPWHGWLTAALHTAGANGATPAGEFSQTPLSGSDLPLRTPEATTEAAGRQAEQPAAQGTAPSAFETDSQDATANRSRNVTDLANTTTPLSDRPDNNTYTPGAPYEDSKSDHAPSSLVPPSPINSAATPNGAKPVLGDEALYLDGAGCIILHPFIEELFRSNALLDGRNFRDEASRGRAVHMLARLTFGSEVTPEYELLLPKLLCGMPWEDSLQPVELSDQEHTACDELLHAVLRHWNALKSNSTDWMREQFFLRSAKLEQLDMNWRLTVERRAQDVLLDRLPWGLGVVGTPWMQGRIYVHWMK